MAVQVLHGKGREHLLVVAAVQLLKAPMVLAVPVEVGTARAEIPSAMLEAAQQTPEAAAVAAATTRIHKEQAAALEL